MTSWGWSSSDWAVLRRSSWFSLLATRARSGTISSTVSVTSVSVISGSVVAARSWTASTSIRRLGLCWIKRQVKKWWWLRNHKNYGSKISESFSGFRSFVQREWLTCCRNARNRRTKKWMRVVELCQEKCHWPVSVAVTVSSAASIPIPTESSVTISINSILN